MPENSQTQDLRLPTDIARALKCILDEADKAQRRSQDLADTARDLIHGYLDRQDVAFDELMFDKESMTVRISRSDSSEKDAQ